MRNSLRTALWLACAALLAACTTTRAPQAPTPSAPTPPPSAAPFRLEPTRFEQLPGWAGADLGPALAAFQRQCQAWSSLAPDTPVARNGAAYGGAVGDWLAACTAAANLAPPYARWLFETHFTPHRVSGPGQAKLTGYYEPAIAARRSPEPGFDEPLLPRPADMVTVDVRAFAERLDSEPLRAMSRTWTGRYDAGRITPYPDRAAIARMPHPPLAWAHPADVYNLQVQGSGRLVFPDGSQTRAAYAGQNGFSWRSALKALGDMGLLAPHPDGAWASFRAYLDANPGEARRVLDADPSYVFFAEEPIADPNAGPRGAAGVALTPGGSLAVDPAFHPYGAPIFIAADAPGFPRLAIAQDTGGAIRRGPRRGDFFLGVGREAGLQALRLDADSPSFTVLLPRNQQVAALADPRS